MRRTSFDNPEKLSLQIEGYFNHCNESVREIVLKNGDVRIRREHPSVIGLAVYLGCSKDTIYSYINGEKKVSDQVSEEAQSLISDLLRNARDRIECSTLTDALNGDADSRIASMVLGNFGYSEKADTTSTLTISVEGGKSEVDQWSK